MKLNLEELIGLSPKKLSEKKHLLTTAFRFADAVIVQDYIDHCIKTNRLVKKILNNV